MGKYIVDIHGDIEGDYEIIDKYEEPKIVNMDKLDYIRDYIVKNVMRNPDIMFNAQIREVQEVDPVDIIASLYNELHEVVTGERYDYMFHWANKVGSDVNEDIFKEGSS